MILQSLSLKRVYVFLWILANVGSRLLHLSKGTFDTTSNALCHEFAGISSARMLLFQLVSLAKIFLGLGFHLPTTYQPTRLCVSTVAHKYDSPMGEGMPLLSSSESSNHRYINNSYKAHRSIAQKSCKVRCSPNGMLYVSAISHLHFLVPNSSDKRSGLSCDGVSACFIAMQLNNHSSCCCTER